MREKGFLKIPSFITCRDSKQIFCSKPAVFICVYVSIVLILTFHNILILLISHTEFLLLIWGTVPPHVHLLAIYNT